MVNIIYGWNTHYPDIFFRERETGFSEASVRLGFCTSSKIVVILAECRYRFCHGAKHQTSQAVGFYDCNMVINNDEFMGGYHWNI